MDTKAFAKSFVDELMKAAGERQKHDLPAGFTLTTNWMHGVQGIFGTAGIERDIFSSRVQPRGLLGVLPAFGSNATHPIVGFLTGVTQGDTDNQNYPCDDPPSAGDLKSCMIGSAFGRLMGTTDPIQIDRIGEIVNRGEMTDLRVVNDPIMQSDLAVSSGMAGSVTAALRQEVLARFYTLGSFFQERLCPMVWTGSTANNSVGLGYQEFNGFESLVTTGYTDVITGASCPSLDSDVKDANYTSVNADAAAIFHWLTTLWRYVSHNAATMGFNPVQWVWVMRDNLFRELSDYWPCVYASYRCNGTANDLNNNADALTMRMMSDEMYNGRYLQIDGVRIPVLIDDCIPEDTNTTNANVPNPCFASDIYLLPMTVRGGYRSTFVEYFNFNGPNGVSDALVSGFSTDEIMVSDGGRFLWTKRRTLTCMDWQALTKLRLRLLTPMLAGRLQNVVYCPLQAFRSPLASQPYFVDGGNTTGSNSPYYADRAQ